MRKRGKGKRIIPTTTVDEKLLRERLQRLTDDSNTADAVAAIVAFAKLARLHGLLCLEEYFPAIKDPPADARANGD